MKTLESVWDKRDVLKDIELKIGEKVGSGLMVKSVKDWKKFKEIDLCKQNNAWVYVLHLGEWMKLYKYIKIEERNIPLDITNPDRNIREFDLLDNYICNDYGEIRFKKDKNSSHTKIKNARIDAKNFHVNIEYFSFEDCVFSCYSNEDDFNYIEGKDFDKHIKNCELHTSGPLIFKEEGSTEMVRKFLSIARDGSRDVYKDLGFTSKSSCNYLEVQNEGLDIEVSFVPWGSTKIPKQNDLGVSITHISNYKKLTQEEIDQLYKDLKV